MEKSDFKALSAKKKNIDNSMSIFIKFNNQLPV